jgi:hypothetical protein
MVLRRVSRNPDGSFSVESRNEQDTLTFRPPTEGAAIPVPELADSAHMSESETASARSKGDVSSVSLPFRPITSLGSAAKPSSPLAEPLSGQPAHSGFPQVDVEPPIPGDSVPKRGHVFPGTFFGDIHGDVYIGDIHGDVYFCGQPGDLLVDSHVGSARDVTLSAKSDEAMHHHSGAFASPAHPQRAFSSSKSQSSKHPHKSDAWTDRSKMSTNDSISKDFARVKSVRQVKMGKTVWGDDTRHVLGEPGQEIHYEGTFVWKDDTRVVIKGEVTILGTLIVQDDARCTIAGQATFPQGLVLRDDAKVLAEAGAGLTVNHHCTIQDDARIDLSKSRNSLLKIKAVLSDDSKLIVKSGTRPFPDYMYPATHDDAQVHWVD